MIGEFGTDSGGWNRGNDPYLRGFRQGIWGGAIGGSVGTSMSWYWEIINSENDYPVYQALGSILNRTGWGHNTWTNIGFQTAGAPPVTVGSPIPGAAPVNVQLPLNGLWGALTPGQLAVPGLQAAGYSANALEGFVHGFWHSDLKTPFKMNACLTNNARLVMHLNSVSEASIMIVRVDGVELYRTNLPNLDGTYAVNEEYNLDFSVNLPAGNRFIEITNAGNDWFYLDWVRLEQVQPANYASNWTQSPDAIGVRGSHESLLYVVAPGVSFPANATTATLPAQHAQTVTLTNWPAGTFIAEWYDPATATSLGLTQAASTNGNLALPLPDYSEDLAAVLYPPPLLTSMSISSTVGFQFRLDSETGGRYQIQKSGDLSSWTPLLSLTNATGTSLLTDPPGGANSRSFYRAKKVD